MKRIVTLSSFVFIFAAAVSAQSPCTRHKEAAGGFSYCPPAGWSALASEAGPYQSFEPPTSGSLKANMILESETTTASHEAYMVAAIRILLEGNEARGAEARKIVGWTEFKTDSKLTGSRMVYEISYRGMLMRTLQVILDLPGKKLILTGTALVTDKDTTDKIFEAVAKSIAVSR